MSKTNSPLYRRRQARGISMEDAYAISEAGRDRVTETIGKEIGGVGAALQAALEKGRKAKGERDAAAKTAAENAALNDRITNEAGATIEDLELSEMKADIDEYDIPTSPTESSAEEVKNSGRRKYTDEMAWKNLTSTQKTEYATRGITNLAEFTLSADEFRDENPGYINIATKDNKRDSAASTPWGMPRLSPIKRRRISGGPRFRQEAASVYGAEPIPEGSSDSSQYENGKTFVEKEYRLPGASFMGNAAIEGYNMGVDKRNYERQVNADMLDYVNNATKGLDVNPTGISMLDRSISEASVEMKKQFFQHQKERNQWAAEGRLAEWNTQNDQYKNFSTETRGLLDTLRSGINEIGEKVKSGEIDQNASAPEGFSLFTSLMSGDAEIGIVNTKNGPTLMGSTKHNDPVNIMARGIEDALSGLQFIPKQEPAEFYNDFMTRLNENKIFGVEKQATILPNGNEVMSYNTGSLDNALNVYIKEELKDPNDLRGYASALLGWSYGQYDAVVDSGADPRKIVADKMKQDMDGLLSNVKGYRSETTTGLSTALENERIDIRKEQRTSNKNGKGGNFGEFNNSYDWAKNVYKGFGEAPGNINVSKANQIKGVSTVRVKNNTLQLFDSKANLLKTIDFSSVEDGIDTLAGYANSQGLEIGKEDKPIIPPHTKPKT